MAQHPIALNSGDGSSPPQPRAVGPWASMIPFSMSHSLTPSRAGSPPARWSEFAPILEVAHQAVWFALTPFFPPLKMYPQPEPSTQPNLQTYGVCGLQICHVSNANRGTNSSDGLVALAFFLLITRPGQASF